jgi:hypothetical protein
MIAWHKTIALSHFILLVAGCAGDSSEDSSTEDGPDGTTAATTSSSPPGSTGASTADGGSGGGNVAVDCDAAPCGGDVVGAWSYSDACSASPWTEETCAGSDPPLTMRSRYVQYPKGSVTFAADGTSTIEKSVVAGWEFVIPKACLFSYMTCENAVQGDGVSCVQEGTDCLCDSIAEGPVETAHETYVIDGTSMIVGSGAEAATLEYCVKDDALKLLHPETAEATFLTRQ